MSRIAKYSSVPWRFQKFFCFLFCVAVDDRELFAESVSAGALCMALCCILFFIPPHFVETNWMYCD